MLSTVTALFYTLILGSVIFLCRALPFILFTDKWKAGPAEDPGKRCPRPADRDPGPDRETGGGSVRAFLGFVEKVAPPVAMTVLALNSLAGPVKAAGANFPAEDAYLTAAAPLAAAACTAALHIWKRNALISIFGGTVLYMILERL
ncbi:MAG: AzlD domain-containing protein [Spirochaetaceae bacterium]|jgi:branched-subunit amino acid transport protein AzlD|nr:AzlD domain-containing protein [Spirochaetaceae bacterium]